MKFKIVPEVLASFPDTKIGVILVTNVNNESENNEILSLLKKQQEIVLSKLNKESLAKHSHILDWQEAYKKFGAKPKDYLSSIENLITRILKNQEVKSVNKLVDLYNIISLKYLIPAGGEDLDKISGDIELAVAGDNEIPVKLLGEKEEKSPKKGEVFYKDKNGAICRRWNWKEADRSKLTKETKNAFLVFEGLTNTDLNLLKAAIYELASYIEKYCGGNISFAFLDKNNPEILIKNNDSFQKLDTKKEEIAFSEDVYVKQNNKQENKTESISHIESAEHEIRLEKVKKLRALGIEPWPAVKKVTGNSKQIKDEFVEGQEKKYSVAGRIMTKRLHGKTAFVDLQDGHGKIQVYIRQDVIGDKNFENFDHLIDIGDILWVHGSSFKTKMGEITIKADEITLESKCLFPLPEKFHGLTDIETKYRQRYLDLMTNQETKDRFIKRSAIISSIRSYLNDHGYIEVETPMLHPIAGGAAAKPFVTHHNALSDNFYLRIAPELYLKRLIVGGFERVYEINRNFRNEGVSTRHNPEFTMLEFYTANQDYHYAMDFVQDIIRSASLKANGTATVQYGDYVIDFSKDFERISAKNALIKYANLKEDDLSETNIDKTIQVNKVKLKNKNITLSEKIFVLFEELVESKLIQPTFIIDFPIEISPLAKRSAQDPNIAARYELFIAGMEVANSFNELNDPFDQADRFKDQLKAKELGDEEAHEYDADFIRALEYGLPPTVGVGIGIDRLVMLLTNTTSIKEVILFPTLKKSSINS